MSAALMYMSPSPVASPYTSREELLETFDGDAAFVRELIVTFDGRCPILIGEILSGFHAVDPDAVSRAAHALKGSVSYFDHGKVYAAVCRLEQITRSELQRVPILVVALEQRLAELNGYLSREFPS